MKSSWISFVVLEVAVLLAIAVVPPSWAAKGKAREPEDLTNFFLSPRYSQWLVGPISRIATEQEIKTFLSLQVDEEATAFIEEFWHGRGGSSVIPGQGPRSVFENRVEEANRLFGEGTNKGHRTDRGTLFVLYGEPGEIRFDVAPRGRGDYLEIWEYPKTVESGLDSKKPERLYRFVKKDGRTVLYKGPLNRRLPGAAVRQ